MGSPGLLHNVWLWSGTELGKSQGPRADGCGRSLPQPFSPFSVYNCPKYVAFFHAMYTASNWIFVSSWSGGAGGEVPSPPPGGLPMLGLRGQAASHAAPPP